MGRDEVPPPNYVFQEVADDIAARIASGEIALGAKLPGERELGEEYGVATATARRAVRELRDRGLVSTLPQKGTYVVRRNPASSPRTEDKER